METSEAPEGSWARKTLCTQIYIRFSHSGSPTFGLGWLPKSAEFEKHSPHLLTPSTTQKGWLTAELQSPQGKKKNSVKSPQSLPSSSFSQVAFLKQGTKCWFLYGFLRTSYTLFMVQLNGFWQLQWRESYWEFESHMYFWNSYCGHRELICL